MRRREGSSERRQGRGTRLARSCLFLERTLEGRRLRELQSSVALPKVQQVAPESPLPSVLAHSQAGVAPLPLRAESGGVHDACVAQMLRHWLVREGVLLLGPTRRIVRKSATVQTRCGMSRFTHNLRPFVGQRSPARVFLRQFVQNVVDWEGERAGEGRPGLATRGSQAIDRVLRRRTVGLCVPAEQRVRSVSIARTHGGTDSGGRDAHAG